MEVTINQFQNNSITGTTTTGITTTTITYADPSDPNGQNSANATIFINSPQLSQFPVTGNTTVEQSFLQYPTDLEYFQLITGLTVSNFLNLSTGSSGFYESSYLLHNISYIIPTCSSSGTFVPGPVITDVITYMQDYQNFEVCIFVRGVDAFTAKQNIYRYCECI